MSKRKLTETTKKIVASSQSWRCDVCKNTLPPSYQIDHIIPHSISEDDSEQNLRALCPTCHSNKTQVENRRIIDYKKIKRFCPDKNVCWFCFETYSTFHTCSKEKKTLDTIIKENTNIIKNTKNMFKKYSYITSMLDENIIELQRLSIRDTRKKVSIVEPPVIIDEKILKIELSEHIIRVNNYFTDVHDGNYDIDVIAQAVFIATRSKKESGYYDKVEIDIDFADMDIDDNCVEYLQELHSKLPRRIFSNREEIEYTYILN